jgi:hypothetical protein
MLEELAKAHAAAELNFFNDHTALFERPAFTVPSSGHYVA